jgi:hypothetical protein
VAGGAERKVRLAPQWKLAVVKRFAAESLSMTKLRGS